MTKRSRPPAAIIIIVVIAALTGCPDKPEPVYLITYHLGGGTNHVDNPTTYRQDSAAIVFGEPTKVGYTFGGWYSDEAFSTPAVTGIPAGSAGDIALYAEWIAQTYTVSFDAQGGSDLSIQTKEVTYASAYGELATVTFAEVGYEFGGWFTQPLGSGTHIESPSLVSVAEDHTLYAYKSSIVYDIGYTLNGGSDPGTNPETYTIESETIVFDDPIREGYGFAGWYGNAEFTGDPITDIPEGSHGDVVVFAKWVMLVYTITYHLNAGTDPATNPGTYTIESDDIVLDDPARDAYLFGGWYGDAGFNGPAVTQIPHGSTGDVDLYAKWTSKEYVITYILNGGTNALANPATYTIESADIVFTDPERTGHTFDGWYADAGFSDPPVTLIAQGSSGDVIIYAKWSANSYTVYFDAGSGTLADPTEKQVTFGQQYGTLATTNRVGYSFGGWFTETDGGGTKIEPTSVLGIATDHTLHAKWIANNYTVTFNSAPGTAADPSDKQVTYGEAYGELAVTNRLGYTFTGWYTEVDGGGSKIEPSVVVAFDADDILYAKWVANDYTVSFDAKGGEVSVESIKVTFDGTYGDLPTATKNGYTFQGWNTEEDGSGDDIETTTVVSTAMDHKLHAKWQAIVYTITYILYGGNNDGANPATYTIETATIALGEPEKNGYDFKGWYGDAGFSGPAVTQIPLGSTGERTFHAKWTPTVYSITYNLYGGTNDGVNPATYTIETPTITFNAPEKNGYTFQGWYTNAGYMGDPVTEIANGSTGNRTLHAKWQVIVYTISYVLNAGTNHGDNPDSYTVEDEIDLLGPTRDYYDFKGWYADAGFTDPAVTQIPLGSTGDRTFHAKWTPTVYSITYNLYGGTNDGDNPATYTIESDTITFSDPTKAGYYFAGWFIEDSFNTMKLTVETGSHGPVTLNAKWNVLYQIGDHVPSPGGIVFYDNVDYDYRVDQWRYLAAMEMDVPGNVEWIKFNVVYDDDEFRLVGGTSTDIGTGYENSQMMLEKAEYRNSAANACISVDGNEDWHLPSKDELDKVYKMLHLSPTIATNFQAVDYWSSSEQSLDLAWSQNFSNGLQTASATANQYKIIPIRRL